MGLFACTTYTDKSITTQKTSDRNFDLISDFDANRGLFRPDTFQLSEQSTDGGELIAFHTKDRDYIVLDAWIYGETGKLHATFWTDMDLNIRIAQRTLYRYDRPYYESGFKTEETTEYFSFVDNNFRAYDKQRIDITDELDRKRIEVQNLFMDLAKEAKIVK